MSSENEFFPRTLKWVSLGCLAVLGLATVLVYSFSPKLTPETRVQQANQYDQEFYALLERITPIQASSAAGLSLTSSSSASLTTPGQQSVQSVTDHDPADSNTADPSSAQTTASATPQPKKTQPTNCPPQTKPEAMIMGIVIDSHQLYLTPQHHLYKALYQQLDHQRDIRWFCNEKEAKQSGWQEATSADHQLFPKQNNSGQATNGR